MDSSSDPAVNIDGMWQLITDMAMVVPTVELAEYFTHVGGPVYLYAFNHHKQPDPAIFQARGKTVIHSWLHATLILDL